MYIYIYIHIPLSLSLFYSVYFYNLKVRCTTSSLRGTAPRRDSASEGYSAIYIYIYICIYIYIYTALSFFFDSVYGYNVRVRGAARSSGRTAPCRDSSS